MSEPAKKPGQQPEGYQPKKPEIVGMVEAAQGKTPSEEPAARQPIKAGAPIRPTDYDFHFSGFRGLDFTNCFTALFLYLEGIQGVDEPCLTLANHAERHFHLFDTMSGRSATVRGWGDVPTAVYSEIYDTEDMVAFLMGYVGYVYEKHTERLMERIRASLDSGIPVLARMKDDKKGSFRVIHDYQGDKLLTPEPKGAQNKPRRAPKLGEIDSVYVVTGRAQRKYTLLDGLRRFRGIMERDREAGAWDAYIAAFEGAWKTWESDNMRDFSMGAFKRLLQTAYKGTTWNCHNTTETFRIYHEYEENPARFRNPVWDELRDPRIEPAARRLDGACHNSWSYQWQLRVLPGVRRPAGMQKYSLCDMAVMLLRQIKDCDGIVYSAVCEMIAILEEGAA